MFKLHILKTNKVQIKSVLLKAVATFVTVGLSFLATNSTASAQLVSEQIDSFNTQITIQSTGEVVVKEEINYYFDASRHGIIRDIQRVFTNAENKKFQTPIAINSVTNGFGKNLKYEAYENGELYSVKIGDPNRTVTGRQTYIITYTVKGAIENFSDHDELYWNVTGNGWDIPIQKVRVTVFLPSQIPTEKLKADCYTGLLKETQKNCSSAIGTEGLKGVIFYQATKPLNPKEGISVVLSIPSGYINKLSKEPYKSFKLPDLTVLLGLIFWYGVLPFCVLLFYIVKGRDPKINTAIPALFEPPAENGQKLSPGEVGTLFDESADNSDITATIVDLAIRGYIKITEFEKEGFIDKALGPFALGLGSANYLLERVETFKTKGEEEVNLKKHEIRVLDGLFGSKNSVYTNDLKDKFADDSQKIKDGLYSSVIQYGYFDSNPNNVRGVWYAIGIISLVTVNIPFGVVCLLLAKAMPRKTEKGARVQVDVKGLRKFLTSQERQLEFQEENWYLFEKLLPYAIALGVTETWAKRFDHINQIPTDLTWYTGPRLFNTHSFVNSMNTFNSSVQSFSTPTRSSGSHSSGFGGGGFSGGGFGGGGGGRSW